jgi:monoamine oxidase
MDRPGWRVDRAGPGPIKALMTEYGVGSYKQYVDGMAMMIIDGKQHR